MAGGQSYVLAQTGQSGSLRWYNITSGMRYTVKYDGSQWTVTAPSGAYLLFNGVPLSASEGYLTDVFTDTTTQNHLTYYTVPGTVTGTIRRDSARTITFSDTGITYGNSQSIVFTKSYRTNGWSGLSGGPAD